MEVLMKGTVIALVLLFTMTGTARAQDVTVDHSHSWFGVRAGYMSIDDMDDGGSANIGFTSGLRVNNTVAVEFSIDYHSSDFSEADRTTYAFQCSALVFFAGTRAKFQPYLVGGIGYYLSGYDYYRDGYRYTNFNTDKFGLHGGVGADFQVAPNAWMTLDVRYLFVDEDAPDMDSVDGILATVGTKFRF